MMDDAFTTLEKTCMHLKLRPNLDKKTKRNFKILHGNVQELQEENHDHCLTKFVGEAHKKHKRQVSRLQKTIFYIVLELFNCF